MLVYSAWISNTELTPITPEDCKDVQEKGKSKLLIQAYSIAAEGHDLAWFKEMLREHQAAMDEDAAARAEKEAKKANKSKRKSMDVTATAAKDEDADEMDVDEEDGESKPKSKKRKKSLDSDGAEEKVWSSTPPKLAIVLFNLAREDSEDRHQAQSQPPEDSSRICFQEKGCQTKVFRQEISGKDRCERR